MDKTKAPMIRNTLSVACIIVLSIMMSCNDDDEGYCPDSNLFFDEYQSIQDCSNAMNEDELRLAVIGTWQWNYEFGSWTGIDCGRLANSTIEFRSNGQLIMGENEGGTSTWEVVSKTSGVFLVRVHISELIFTELVHVCDNKIAFSSPSIADSNTHIFSK